MIRTVLLLTLGLALGSCKKDEGPTWTPLGLLPPKTQIGANTGGCLVNGGAFLPNRASIEPLVCHYLDGEDFYLGISQRVKGVYFSIIISIEDTPLHLQVGRTQVLNTRSIKNARAAEYIINTEPYPSPNYYSTTPSVTGELIITHHDFDNAFMSGTFWFDAVNSQGDTIKVREGRFDMEY